MTFFLVNLFGTLTYCAVLSPMVLSRTGGDEAALSTVRTMMGLADRLFEPALQPGGWLVSSAGLLVGSGPGAGMAAMFLCTCLLGSLTGRLGLLLPTIRRLEERPHGAVELAALPKPGE